MELQKAVEFIRQKDNFLLSTHVNPDGDGVGAIIGLMTLLGTLGKKYKVVLQDPPQKKLSFLKGFNELQVYRDSMREKESFGNAIIVDVPHLDRIGKSKNLIAEDAEILNIDHHISNDNYGTVNVVDADAAASSQVVADLFGIMKIELDKDTAMALYTGVCVDTGSFRYANTNAKVLRLATRLVEKGAEPATVTEYLYMYCTLETTMGLSTMISTIELHYNGRFASAYLDYEFLSTEEGRHVDTEGFVNYPLSIDGVEVAFLIRETEENKNRLSFRSNSDFDVNKFANRFGGGGHSRASGCRMDGSIDEVKKKILAEMEVFAKNGGV